MKNENEFHSKDFYTSSVLLASGEKLIRLEKKENSKSIVFVFETAKRIAEKTILAHWDKTLRLPTRDLIEAINELKTRIHSI